MVEGRAHVAGTGGRWKGSCNGTVVMYIFNLVICSVSFRTQSASDDMTAQIIVSFTYKKIVQLLVLVENKTLQLSPVLHLQKLQL